MFQCVVPPVAIGAGSLLQNVTFADFVKTKPDAFQRLPVNLSSDEIRAMVQDILG